jgi:hypothetical protein
MPSPNRVASRYFAAAGLLLKGAPYQLPAKAFEAWQKGAKVMFVQGVDQSERLRAELGSLLSLAKGSNFKKKFFEVMDRWFDEWQRGDIGEKKTPQAPQLLNSLDYEDLWEQAVNDEGPSFSITPVTSPRTGISGWKIEIEGSWSKLYDHLIENYLSLQNEYSSSRVASRYFAAAGLLLKGAPHQLPAKAFEAWQKGAKVMFVEGVLMKKPLNPSKDPRRRTWTDEEDDDRMEEYKRQLALYQKALPVAEELNKQMGEMFGRKFNALLNEWFEEWAKKQGDDDGGERYGAPWADDAWADPGLKKPRVTVSEVTSPRTGLPGWKIEISRSFKEFEDEVTTCYESHGGMWHEEPPEYPWWY